MAAYQLDFINMTVDLVKSKWVVRPEMLAKKSKDLLVKGGKFYAIWDEEAGMWSTDLYRAIELIDDMTDHYMPKTQLPMDPSVQEAVIVRKHVAGSKSKLLNEFTAFMKTMADSPIVLDRDVTFKSEQPTRRQYRSKKLEYDPEDIPTPYYDKLMSTIWPEKDRERIEWCIGAMLVGDSKEIQKFLVMYGPPQSGKSTTIAIMKRLLEGYDDKFSAESIAKAKSFATSLLASNPLMLYDEDSDLSRVFDNTVLNSLISHEPITIDQKYQSAYNQAIDSFVVLGTNSPVQINSTKSGITRRLLDVNPTNNKLSNAEFREGRTHWLGEEIPGIAYHCIELYSQLGPDYYDGYRSEYMVRNTNVVHEFMEFFAFDSATMDSGEQEWIQARKLFLRYKDYAEAMGYTPLPYNKFRTEVDCYWKDFKEDYYINGSHHRWCYLDLDIDRLQNISHENKPQPLPKAAGWLIFEPQHSLLDDECALYPAQYANANGNPAHKWEKVDTKLKDIDTSKLHWVQVPENLIVIDFDIPNKNGEKDYKLNYKQALEWPETYAELSKSQAGIHLHYIYDGPVDELADHYDDKIEVKVYKGNSSLRRLVTQCNNIPIAHLKRGDLPLKPKRFTNYTKGENPVVNMEEAKINKWLTSEIVKAFRKEHHGATAPEIDYIKWRLDQAYESGKPYDVSVMENDVITFALTSTHQSERCLNTVSQMHFKSAEDSKASTADGDQIIFYDVEVFPNLFLINWKYLDVNYIHRMINPEPEEVMRLCEEKLVGFNNKHYDNHILYAWAYMGYNNQMLYDLSKRIISGDNNAKFAQAYNLSYADIHDFSSKKQSLKKWEIELGIHHQELGLPWDEPVPREKWDLVAEYCDNDVIATEALWKSRAADFTARCIMADLSGLPINASTQKHAEKIIFEDDKNARDELVYTDLREEFPGYEYGWEEVTTKSGQKKRQWYSRYKGYNTGEGGFVYADHGLWHNVETFDVDSMHPHSAKALNVFGKYTKNFWDIVQARLDIKRGDFESAKTRLNGRLAKYLTDESQAKDLAYALKIIINSIYGYTKQDPKRGSPFTDPRNVDNIIAKRGALFMIDLKEAVEAAGYHVVHIKTDSIKIDNPDDKVRNIIFEMGKKYGYTFAVESKYEKMCLVNNAVYIAYGWDKDSGVGWHATGAQFARPYVFKKLFTHDDITVDDLGETKEVKVPYEMYLQRGDNLDYIGRVGRFVPVRPGTIGGALVKTKDHEKFDAVTGTKGFEWVEAEAVTDAAVDYISYAYHDKLADEALEALREYCDDVDDFCKTPE